MDRFQKNVQGTNSEDFGACTLIIDIGARIIILIRQKNDPKL